MLKLDILVHPTCPEAVTITPEQKAEAKRKKWRFPWRINMLSLPKFKRIKYVTPPPEPFKIFGPVEAGVEFRSEQLASPFLRKLYENKWVYHERGTKYVKTITKTIDKSWGSIYNYYRKKLREKRLKKLKRKMERKKAKKPKGKELEKIESERKERLDKIAKPKSIFLPPKIVRKRKALEDLAANIDTLSQPKERHIVPPREIGVVNPRALEYEITETILKLAQIPDKMKQRQSEPNMLGCVKKAALTAKSTPRIEKLAQPSFSAREAKKQDEDKYDPWIISPNALKYKPSARILELAKPMERD